MGRTSRAIAAGALVAAVLAALTFASAQHLWHKDALDYAQIARELASGEGFTSRQAVYVLHLRFLKEHGLLEGAWPNVHRFPLQSLVLVPSFLLLGPSATAVLLTGIVLCAMTAALLFDWADSTLGRWPAIAATALLTLNGDLFYEVAAGIPEPATGFFFLLAVYLLWHAWRRSSGRWLAVASGAALGLAVLARTNVVTALPGMLFVTWRGSAAGGRAKAMLLLATFLAVLAPWGVRNLRLAGSPSFSLHSYFLIPAGSVQRESKRDLSVEWVRDFVSPVDYVSAHPREVWGKWTQNALAFVGTYPWFANTFLAPLLAWLALLPRFGGSLHPLAIVTCTGLVANLAFCALTDLNLPRYSYFLLPPLMLLAVAVVWAALQRAHPRWLRVGMLCAATIVMARPSALDAAFIRIRSKGRIELAPDVAAAIERYTPPDGVVLSSASHLVTWVTGRRSIRAHYERASGRRARVALLPLDDEFGPIDALYLPGGFARRERERGRLAALLEDPRFVARFRCLPPLSRGALLCVRRGAGDGEGDVSGGEAEGGEAGGRGSAERSPLSPRSSAGGDFTSTRKTV